MILARYSNNSCAGSRIKLLLQKLFISKTKKGNYEKVIINTCIGSSIYSM